MLAILAPLHEELKTLRLYLEVDTTVYLRQSLIWHGRLGSHPCIVARAGIGTAAMQSAAAYCLRHLGATQLLLLGFAGATAPHLHIGDLIIGDTIVAADDATTWKPAAALTAEAAAICEAVHLTGQPGRIVTVHALVPSPHEKAFLGTQHQAIAVDMESSALARVAEDAGVPWLVVRAIIDPMDTSLPAQLARVNPDGTAAIGLLLRTLVQHPRFLGQLPRLYYAAAKAREHLTTFAKAWIAGR